MSTEHVNTLYFLSDCKNVVNPSKSWSETGFSLMQILLVLGCRILMMHASNLDVVCIKPVPVKFPHGDLLTFF